MENFRCFLLAALSAIFGVLAGFGQSAGVKVTVGEKDSRSGFVAEGDRFLFTGHVEVLHLAERHWPGGHLHPAAGGEGETSVELGIPGFFPAGEPGEPELPAGSYLFECGREEVVRITIHVLDSQLVDLSACGFSGKLAPVLPPQTKRGGEARDGPDYRASRVDDKPARPDSLVYALDDWLGGPVVSVAYQGIMRGVPLSALQFRPVRYNPARNQLMVYHHVSCTIETVPAKESRPPGGPSPEAPFKSLLNRVVLRGDGSVKKAILSDRPMTMVILSDTLFREGLQPLVRWKRKKGFHVVEAYVQDTAVGATRGSIREYLGSLYRDPPPGVAAPSYLLIVGDVGQIPLSQSSGQVTDLYYAEYDGEGDYIPDLFYGRISVEDTQQLQNVIDKILEYEQFRFPDPSFLGESVLIAGVDGTFAPRHGNGQINYASGLYFNPSRGILSHNFLYPASDTSAGEILELISRGVGFVNYTGHGLYDGWIDPSFHQGDIPGLQNTGKYPVIIGNGCQTNVFSVGECFAESLLRAPGRGALAYIGCTNDSYWDEDFYWSVGVGPIVADPVYGESSPGFYDRVFHLNGEEFGIWAPSLGEMVFGGNMAVQQSTSPRKKFYWEIYQLAGDPSMVPWFGVPVPRDVSHPSLVPPGTRRLDVEAAPYDYAALSAGGVLLDARHAGPDGAVTLRIPDTLRIPGTLVNPDSPAIPDTLSDGELDLVVTGQGYQPYAGQVQVGTMDGPYLELGGHSLSGESVAADRLLSSGETAAFDLEIINRGALGVMSDTLLVSSASGGITLLDSMVVLEELAAGDTILLGEAFRVRASGTAEDGTVVSIGVRRTADPGNRNYIKQGIVAPRLRSAGIRWDDRPGGNGNGIAEPGEWLHCTWNMENMGHFRSGPIRTGILHPGQSPFDSLQSGVRPGLEAGESCEYPFLARVGNLDPGMIWPGSFTLGDGSYTVQDSFPLVTGRHFEDFSQYPDRNPDRYPFDNDPSAPWFTDPTTFFSSPASFRSGKTGASQESRLSVDLQTMRTDTLSFAFRVSSETGYDFLRLELDSTLVESWSGEIPWSAFSFPLGPGDHRITWAYRKDHSVSRGEDAAWIDDVVFPADAFRRKDLSLIAVTAPSSGPWLTDREEVRLLVANTGTDTLHGFSAGIQMDGLTGDGLRVDRSPVTVDSFLLSLAPGDRLEIATGLRLDLSSIGDYRIEAEVTAMGESTGGSIAESFTGNNRMEKVISRYPFPDIGLELERVEEVPGVRADVLVQVRNMGNIPVDSLLFQVWLDSMFRSGGSRFIGLEPGEEELLMFNLADSSDSFLTGGFHDYLIRSVVPDSVTGNDLISGVLYWQGLGLSNDLSLPDLLVYPNPAGAGFHVLLGAPAYGPIHMELLDATGRVCGSWIIPGGTDHLYVPVTVPPGSYLLTIPGTGAAIPLVLTRD